MYHASYWVDAAPGEWVAIASPFSEAFLKDLKSLIPWHAHTWRPQEKVRLVRPLAYAAVLTLLQTHFPDTFCPACQAKTSCLYWSCYPQARLWPSSPTEEAEKLLGLTPPYTELEVRAAYRQQALRTHPDKGGTAEAFRAVKQATSLLLQVLGSHP